MLYNVACIFGYNGRYIMIDYAAYSDAELQSLTAKGNRSAEEALAGRYLQLVRACARPLFLAGGDSSKILEHK